MSNVPSVSSSPYGSLSPFTPSDATAFGPNTPLYNPGWYPGQPVTNLQTTYSNTVGAPNASAGVPALDPRAQQSMQSMDDNEIQRQEARCPTCAAAIQQAQAHSRACATTVGAAAAAGAVGGAVGGSVIPGIGSGGSAVILGGVGGGYAYLTSADCGNGTLTPIQVSSGVK